MKKYLLFTLAIIFPIFVVAVYYLFYNIDGSTWSGACMFREVTGLECPGCGGQRTLYHVLHGNILQALRYNAFFVIAFPFMAYLYYACLQVYVLKNEKYLKTFIFKSSFAYGLLITIILFFILRNIPVFPFTYLAPPTI